MNSSNIINAFDVDGALQSLQRCTVHAMCMYMQLRVLCVEHCRIVESDITIAVYIPMGKIHAVAQSMRLASLNSAYTTTRIVSVGHSAM